MGNSKSAILLLFAISASAVAQPSSAKTQIQALYDKAGGLLIHQDVNGFVKLLQETRTPGYTYITKQGRHHLNDLLKSMSMVLSTFRVTKSSVRIDKISNSKDGVIVNITTIIGLETKATKSRTRHTVEQEVHGEDSWVRLGTQWKLKLSRIVTENVIEDGKTGKS
jgi:hypothetical protein